MKYDLLVVGSGLFGCIIAEQANKRGKKVLVVERRSHIGGNCYTENIKGINVHKYGAHIFRTNDKIILDYFTQFCELNNFVNCPVANYKGELYNLPFNMNTFYQLWGCKTPREAMQKLQEQRVINSSPSNLEEHVLDLVGLDIYEKLIKSYTEKQWGKPCTELPKSIIRRLPLRFTFDNNYFNARYQGIPIGGYTSIFEKMLSGCDLLLNVDFLKNKSQLSKNARKIVYTGAIDELYDYCYGPLEYRSLKFEHNIINEVNYQGVAVMNFTDDTPYTRTIEHKHFEFGHQDVTVITKEYPITWTIGMDPYYPIEDTANQQRYNRYKKLLEKETNLFIGGRLGEYRYYDMENTIRSALEKAKAWEL